MPTYLMIHKQTGEEKEMFLSLSAREEFLVNNPEWESGITKPMGLVGDSKTPLRRAGSGWNDHLKRMKSGSGRTNTIKT
jgi:hypothetical protein